MSNMNTLISILREGNVSIPRFIINNYKKMDLSDIEFLVLLHIFSMADGAESVFDISLLVSKTSLSFDEVYEIVEKLKSKNFLDIKVRKDHDGKLCEYVNLDNFFIQVSNLVLNLNENISKEVTKETKDNLFITFEQCFSRPLTPMEYEMILKWVEEGHSEKEILSALREALYKDVRNIKYIDRILANTSPRGNVNINSQVDNSKYIEDDGEEIVDFDW